MDIPTIDLLPFYTNDKEKMNTVANQIARACQDIGAFYVTNSNLPTFSNHSENLFQLLRFFDLPIEIKNRISAKNNIDHRGYGSVDDIESNERREWVYVGNDDGDSYEKNQWLDEKDLPGWKDAIKNNFQLMSTTGRILYQAFSLALNREMNFLEEKFSREPTVLLLRYPPGGRCAEHTDVGFLAINLLDPIGGLQIKPRNHDRWVDVSARENTFLCHIGDALECITHGQWYSVPHRVQHEKQEFRHGVVMFNNPHANSIIGPLDDLLTNRPQEIDLNDTTPMIYKDFHRRKMNLLKY